MGVTISYRGSLGDLDRVEDFEDCVLDLALDLGGQALGSDDAQPVSGLSVVQLKRALRGAAFALGALFPLRTDGTLDQSAFDELRDTIQGLQTDVFAELCRFRQRRAGES